MKSLVYWGTVEHHRYQPVNHKLSYPLVMYGFDLDELPDLNQRRLLFGYNRFGITSVQDQDYLMPGNEPVKEKITRLLKQHQVNEPANSIVMITSARYFNYVFNPVNFYYCFSPDKVLIAVVTEVNNTYGERHPYVLTRRNGGSDRWFATFSAPKAFHVSPFNKIEGDYHFYFSKPGDHIEIQIDLVKENQTIMSAGFNGGGKPLSVKNHLKTLAKYPLTPHLSIPRIYTHAFKLFFQRKLTFHDKPVPKSLMTIRKPGPSFLESICQKLIFSALKKMTIGRLTIVLPDHSKRSFGNDPDGLCAELFINDYHFFPRVVLDGEIGFGEAFMHSEWDSPDRETLFKLLIQNRDHFSDGNLMLSFLTRLKEKFSHDQRKNTIKNTPENIAAHYDLSNRFYSLFLDRRMLYSSGIFNTPQDSLETAQENKMRRILEKADIGPDHHILEIGCGWGGFAVFAAKETGCRVTGITVSKAQYEKAVQRVNDEGLADQITILRQDYRHTTGTYDRIVSIEMIEAVGPQYFNTYFKQCWTLLKSGGIMLFQAIIILDDRYDQYCRERDWIQKHIFPGGHLPSVQILKQSIQGNTDFKIADIYHMGFHYAPTLALWRGRFNAGRKEIEAMGFDEIFIRKWNYYFSICEAGFAVGDIDDVQIMLQG